MGLGLMGAGMAENLWQAGYPLTVYNRTPEKMQAFADRATLASSPKALAEQVDIVITMVTDEEAVSRLLFGAEGAYTVLRSGQMVIDMSTVTPALSRVVAGHLQRKGVSFLDAPVSGSKPEADGGQLLIMVGGEEKDVERAQGLFSAMGKVMFHMGPVGAGTSAKLVNNMVSGSTVALIAQAMVLAEKSGLDPQQMLDLLGSGGSASPMLKNKGSAMLAADFSPRFALSNIHKDFNYILAQADEVGVPLPIVAVTKELFQMGKVQGYGDLDFAAIIETVRSMAGLK